MAPPRAQAPAQRHTLHLPRHTSCLHGQVLDLTRNKLRDVPSDLGWLPALRVINISDNPITIPPHVLAKRKRCAHVSLHRVDPAGVGLRVCVGGGGRCWWLEMMHMRVKANPTLPLGGTTTLKPALTPHHHPALFYSPHAQRGDELPSNRG